MRFKDKTYLITLVLFLLFLNAGIFSLAFYTNQKSAENAHQLCYSEQSVIASALEDDFQYLGHNTRAKTQVMKSYGNYYKVKNISLCFLNENGEIVFNNLPEEAVIPTLNSSSTQRIDGARLFLISAPVDFGEYTMIYAKDLSYLDDDFKSISLVFVLTSLGASGLLAILLFFVLRKLSGPLERLSAATEALANGNFESRADESGKDEFAQLAAGFNRMADHIGEQMNMLEENAELKQRMLDNLAHEMRTPLTSIRGYAEYLLNANISEDEKIEAIEFIINESERLKLIGERLLDDAFIRENGIDARNKNLGELVADVAKKLSIIADSRGVELRVTAQNVHCVCDPLLVGMLVSNLVTNAIKACKNGGQVELACEYNDDFAVISVRDNGVGMTEEHLKRITEPFYRTDKSRSRADGGTGLGLALCERIAQAHGAILEFESTLGEGTSARVKFPKTKN